MEHPREEAAAEAAEKKAEAGARAGRPKRPGPRAGEASRSSVDREGVLDRARRRQTRSRRASYTFEVHNEGKIQHDLAVEGGGKERRRR